MLVEVKQSCLTKGGFAGFPNTYVWRQYLIRGIDDLFGTNADVVYLSGKPGIGSTSLAAEYVLHSDFLCVCLFIRGGSRLSYAPFRLANALLEQAELYLGASSLAVTDVVAGWHARFAQLQEYARREGRELLLVVDGLYQIPQEDHRFVVEVFRDLLALGVPHVRHLITTGERQSFDFIDAIAHPRQYRAQRLSLPESSSVFSQAGVPPEKHKDYYAYTDGIPALVQSACKLFAAGVGVEGLSRELSSFYSAEWQQFQNFSDIPVATLCRVLAFMCFCKGALKLQEICTVTDASEADVFRLADREVFIRRTADGAEVEFLSHSHREFVATKLSNQKSAVLNLMIDRLVAAPRSETSLALLPTFFDEIGRVDELLDYLSPENLGSYLDYSRSVTALRRRTELGMRTAIASAKNVHAYRFALQTSMIRAMDSPQVPPEQLGALAGLGEIEQAYAHAQLARSDEERLHVLSILVRELFSANHAIPSLIEDQLRQLLTHEVPKVGSAGREIATNLVGAFPDLAMRVIECIDDQTSKNREQAITQLAIDEAVARGETKKDSVLTRVANDEVRDFVVSIQTMVRAKSIDEVDASTRKLPTRVRAHILRQWAASHSTSPGAHRVIDIALRDLIADASYLPTAGHLWDLSTTLASTTDPHLISELIEKLEGFKGSLSEAGSTIDLVGLDLELAVAEATTQTIASAGRFEEIYLRVAYLEDLALRFEGFVLIATALRRVTSKVFVSGAQSLFDAIETEFSPLTDKLLAETADHILVFEPGLEILVAHDPGAALDIVARFNTEERRDFGFASLAADYATQNRSPLDAQQLRKFLVSISSQATRDEALVDCLRILRSNKKLVGAQLQDLIALIDSIQNPILRCQGLAHGISIDFSPGDKVDNYVERLALALGEIDRSASRPREAFKFVQAVISCDKAEGKRAYAAVEKILAQFRITSESWLNNAYLCTRAAVTSFGSLLEKRAYGDDELARLLSAIEGVPAVGMKTNLFVDLALRAHSRNHNELFDQICAKHVFPLIGNTDQAQRHAYQSFTTEAFCALFIWNQALATELIQRCDRDCREFAAGQCIEYVVTGFPPNEPFQTDKIAALELDYPRAVQVMDLLELIDTDSRLCQNAELVCTAMSTKGTRNTIAGHQRDGLLQRLRKIAASKLPDPRNISHSGWSIVFSSYLALAADAKQPEWERVVGAAEDIPNHSDRVYVYGALLKAVPEKFASLRRACLSRARDALTLIPSSSDAMMRRIALSDVAAGLEKAVAERLLKEALEASASLKDRDAALQVQRNIVDTAQQIDRSLADKLIDLLDDDPARARAKSELRRDAKATKRKEAISDADYKAIHGVDANSLNRACFDALVALNNGRVSPPRVDEIGPIVAELSRFGIMSVFWGFCWFLRACQERLQSTEEAFRTLKVIYEMSLLACEFNQRLSTKTESALIWSHAAADSEAMLVGPSDRREAIRYMLDWFAEQQSESMLICDPYFTLEDIELVKQFFFVRRETQFNIVSCKPSSAPGGAAAISNLQSAWEKVCDQQPPEIKLAVALYEGEKLQGAVHDRWILCREAGLRVGTSVNSLGLSKLSAISQVGGAELQELWATLMKFVRQEERTSDGRRLRYLVEML